MPFKVFGSACEPIDYTGPIVYTYQGNPFNLFKGTFGCPPECTLSGWFSLSDTLTPSALVKVDRPILDDFAFSDANYTLTPVNDLQAQFTLMVRTDASGRLDFSQGWCLSLQGDYRADRPGGANYYHRFLSTSNQLRSSEFGCGGELGSANDGSAYVVNPGPSVVGSAEVFSSPGDWSTSFPKPRPVRVIKGRPLGVACGVYESPGRRWISTGPRRLPFCRPWKTRPS